MATPLQLGNAAEGGLRPRLLAAAGASALLAAAYYIGGRRRSSEARGRGQAEGERWQGDSDASPRSKANELISWKEVVLHKRLDDLWIVINDEVFDVTSWLEKHPGGQRLLLAFAGRDATEAFNSIGHSALARREMRRLQLGKVTSEADAGRARHGGGWGDMPEHRKRPAVKLTGGNRSSAPAPDDKLWEVCNGFLPCRDPVGLEALYGTPFEAFIELHDLIPALSITGEISAYLDENKNLQQRLLACGNPAILDELSEDQLERAFGVVSYAFVSYWRGGTLAFGTGVVSATVKKTPGEAMPKPALTDLPPFLAEPMMLLSKRLERPPMIDYAASVLYNWTRIDAEGPMSTSNIRLIHRLTGLLDEEWFFKTHVVIESEAAGAVSAIVSASQAQGNGDLLTHLVDLEEALWRVVRAGLPIMYERSRDGVPHCSEHIFYHVLRPLIGSGTINFHDSQGGCNEVRLAGPSGAMSSLLPCIDAALGIKTSSERLREALTLFEQSMPKDHREFLATLRSKPPIRARILHGTPKGTEQHEALTRSFNRCIARVLDFRWQHWQYIKNFILKPGNISYAVGSGGTSFDYLQQHITDTQEARLTEGTWGTNRIVSPGEPDMVMLPRGSMHPAPHQQRALELWSVDGVNGLLAREPMCGLSEEWVQALPDDARSAMDVLWLLCRKLPALSAAEGPIVAQVEAASEALAKFRNSELLMGMPEVGLERLMSMLTHLAAACTTVSETKSVPKCIDRPLKLVARALGRPPKLNFTELVLSNWTQTVTGSDKEDGKETPEQAIGAEEEDGKAEAPKLHMVWKFLACPDEEWYRATHMLLHKEASEVVAAIRYGQVAARDCDSEGVVTSLSRLSSWLNDFCDYFDYFFENKDSRSESVTFQRLGEFVAQDLTDIETHCWVYSSGGSVLLPAIHAFLGVQMWAIGEDCPDQEVADYMLTMKRFLEESRMYMPRLHRLFLEDLERPGCSLRQYCFRRFGAKSVSVEGLHTLETAYNDCLNALVRFLSRRTRLVSRFFPRLESTFSRLNSYVEEALRKSRLLLLQMRQNVDRCLEK